MKPIAIQPASLTFNNEGTPVSRDFDDVYFSNDDGLEETRYVFLNGNQLPERFMTHPRDNFVVAESGFGTGLNFLTLWQAFAAFRAAHPDATLQRLHFISFEKFPLTLADLQSAHAHWPELAPWAQALQAQWPMALPGCQRLLLDGGRVTLDLWLGDINALVETLDDTHNRQVDAWFLDGFAPSKNPDMWTPGLFAAMARLARPDGTLATFTSAGFVRRGLIEAGFQVVKRKGFGRKREMLVGTLNPDAAPPARAPWYARRPASGDKDAAIVGGGIASALLALALQTRGWQVTLYCEDDAPARGASGNRQGALYPLLSHHDAALSAFFPAAFTFARRLYDALPVSFDKDWCGVTQLGWDEKSQTKIDRMLELDLPETLARASIATRYRRAAACRPAAAAWNTRRAAGSARRSSPQACWRSRRRAGCRCITGIVSARCTPKTAAGGSISPTARRHVTPRSRWQTAISWASLCKRKNCRSTPSAAR